jgi:ribonucleotide monophosphatase NagD (HAD superfamily)
VVADESGYPFLETVDRVLTTLFARLDRHQSVSLILPNPDLIFPTTAAGFGLAAGSIALILEAALQLRYPHRSEMRFARLGKPHPMMFAAARHLGGSRNMVMVGDQLQTDIRGANAFGIDSVLVTGGVSGTALSLRRDGPLPTHLLDSLQGP